MSENPNSPVPNELVKTLLYFGIFHYPLTQKELRRFCGTITTLEEVEYELGALEKSGYIKQKKGFYALASEDMDAIADRRIKGNNKAERMLKIARGYIKLISSFPFVRGVYLSGSLSKGYADEKSDVDYFIISEPGRLWICRMMLIIFKRIFLFNSHKYFCVNYFIDSEKLEITDRNIFTATELATLIPASNFSLYRKLMQANPWVKEYFPNTLLETVSADSIPPNESWTKKLIEKLFPGKLGDKVDDYCYKLTLATWKRKFKEFSPEEFELNLRSQKNTSKHHPRGFQIKVVKAFNEKLQDFEQKYSIKLS